jgi:perosamine synthetase
LIDPVDLPICDTLYGEGLCLPVHQGLQDSDVHHVIDVIRSTLSRKSSCS